MSSQFSGAVWPDIGAPQAIRDWLARLYPLLDSTSANVPEQVAALYAPNATVYGISGKSVGTAEIIRARVASWTHMVSRSHEVLRVYTMNQDFSDILLIGRVTAKFKNGKEVEHEFTARIVFEGDTRVDPKGTLYQIWVDSAPYRDAIGGGAMKTVTMDPGNAGR